MKKKKIYLSGKITGDPDFREKFARAADVIRREYPEYRVVNPVDLPGEPPESARTEAERWRWYMIRDLRVLARCDLLVNLPGYVDSCGSRVENEFARGVGMQISRFREEYAGLDCGCLFSIWPVWEDTPKNK